MTAGPDPDAVFLDEPCAGSGRAGSLVCTYGAVSWSPVFGVWLCHNCRRYRTDAELRATREANVAAEIDARLAARRAASLGR